MAYKVSKDYKRLKQLLDQGGKVVCFVDNDWNRKDHIVTDIAFAKCTGSGEYMKYQIYGKIVYLSIRPFWYINFSDEKLYDAFGCQNVQFIDPDYERNTLELELKR